MSCNSAFPFLNMRCICSLLIHRPLQNDYMKVTGHCITKHMKTDMFLKLLSNLYSNILTQAEIMEFYTNRMFTLLFFSFALVSN